MNDNDFEEFDEDSLPTPCQHCHEWFDLYDGQRSDKWYPNTVICAKCAGEEEKEIEQDTEIEELRDAISDAEITIRDSKQRLKELGIND